MITIYSIEGEEYLPYKIIGRPLEDSRERQFATNFIHWLTGEALSLFKKPIELIAIAYLWWPVNLYG